MRAGPAAEHAIASSAPPRAPHNARRLQRRTTRGAWAVTADLIFETKYLYTRRVKELALLLNEMRAAGVITKYALFGAVAQMRYTEPVATLDADVLVALPLPERLDALSEIYAFCASRGFGPEGEAIRVGSWPVQFVPVFDALTRAALEESEVADFDGVPLSVVRADYLAVIALSVGRAKDKARILALLESRSVSRGEIARLAARHGLHEAWHHFESRFPSE